MTSNNDNSFYHEKIFLRKNFVVDDGNPLIISYAHIQVQSSTHNCN